MRIFVGFFLPEKIRLQVEEKMTPFAIRGLRRILPENLHVTINFIGDIEENQLPEIADLLQHISQLHSPFKIFLDSAGVFPSRRRPQVYWTAIQGEVKKLQKLAVDIGVGLSRQGMVQENREFKPHLTLARSTTSSLPANLFCNYFHSYRSEPFDVSQIHLIQSVLDAVGPKYKIVQTFNLG